MGMRKIVFLLTLVVVLGFVGTARVSADTKPSPKKATSSRKIKYKDLTVKKVGGKVYYKAIKDIQKHNGFKGIFTGKKFHPNKKITRGDFLIMLENLYGPDAPRDKKTRRPITAHYVQAMLMEVGRNRGVYFKKLPCDSKKVTRAEACRLVKLFADSSSALKY